MLNFRKLKQDYSPSILKEGKVIADKEMVSHAKVAKMSGQLVRLKGKVQSQFSNSYNCEIEVDISSSTIVDSDCDCPHKYDCQHLAAVLFHLEDNFNELIVAYSKEGKDAIKGDDKLEKTIKTASQNTEINKKKKYAKEVLEEYNFASKVLGLSPFFLHSRDEEPEKAELIIVFDEKKEIEFQLALRLDSRSKPLNLPNLKDFFDALRTEEPFFIGNKRYFITLKSFEGVYLTLLKVILDSHYLPDAKGNERIQKSGFLSPETFGMLLAEAYDNVVHSQMNDEGDVLPGFFVGSVEEPLKFSERYAQFNFMIEHLSSPAPKILLKPKLVLDDEDSVDPSQASFYESLKPGLIYHNTYYRFAPHLKRKHLKNLNSFQDLTIPEPLFGTFVENSLPELNKIAKISGLSGVEKFVTVPFVEPLKAECDLSFMNGELEASLSFSYGKIKVPSSTSQLTFDDVGAFVSKDGILARNLTEEQDIISSLFQDFIFDPSQGVYIAKNDRKIVEFMTEVIPANQARVKFNCPENLLEQFLYDNTTFKLSLKESETIDQFECELKVDGHLKGTTLDLLWDCLLSKKPYIELNLKKGTKNARSYKILVLDLEKLRPIIQIFDEIGIKSIDDHKELRPLFNLISLDPSAFNHLPIEFSMSPKLEKIQKQMQGAETLKASEIPANPKFPLRNYQEEGIHWLERIRNMHLGGILADDMGLGKTYQAILALTQFIKDNPGVPSIVVCPTSLVYNWYEEILKFNPKLKCLVIDGNPAERKKLISQLGKYDILVTSYSLLQKDIEIYEEYHFGYSILDEAQHIKNRGTRNAKSVKQIKARHRLILTGTPIENSLDELWSLFDYLMPGLLSSYERFLEKYIKSPIKPLNESLELLKRKVSPFILRRMKKDVLEDLPPVSEIVYHCQLSDVQKDLYKSYAESALEELKKLVKKEGFDKVQIHVLATLTRLKQICCHPAIFAKEKAEMHDSSKYDMLMELLQSLIQGNHKTVIFSQYTKMLDIMRQDLDKMRIPYEYLDGTTKNRLEIVKKFNQDENIPVFLVSLKAGGSGLNLTGADTVIHYDMWWNPAVENQATDRVHRLGQDQPVSVYKLITLNSIEEKIVELQSRKKELVRQVVTCDEEAIAKLTWEEVLELLQT